MIRKSAEQILALQRIAESPSAHIIGVDEVGLGCLAGPITVAAAVFEKGWSHKKVKDSKALSPKGRQRADKIVREQALSYCIFSATNDEIDKFGLHTMKDRLTEQVVLQMLHYFPQALIVQDGNVPTVIGGRPQNMVWLPKADALVPAVSAASCLAKVYRDTFMCSMSYEYPGYGFGSNMGYGTDQHVQALRSLGACYLHRKSFKPVQAVL
jgi:ribonuclease HII